MATLRHFEKGSAASLLYIVAVRGYGQDIERGAGHVSRDCLAQELHSREQSVDAPPFALTSEGPD